jgi:hypothetical protein
LEKSFSSLPPCLLSGSLSRESSFEQRQKEKCKRTARRFGERLFLLVSLPPFFDPGKESTK